MWKRIKELIAKLLSLKVLVAGIMTAPCMSGISTDRLYILLAVWGTVLGTREVQKMVLLLKGKAE